MPSVIGNVKSKSVRVMKKKTKFFTEIKEGLEEAIKYEKEELKGTKYEGMLEIFDEVCDRLNEAGYGPFQWEIVIKRNTKYDV